MRPETERSRPDGNQGGSSEAIGSESITESPAVTIEWQRCPLHPWYGVSVVFTDDAPALCIPPCDGTPNHWHEVAA